jgi:YVTN family beta-propeller protein
MARRWLGFIVVFSLLLGLSPFGWVATGARTRANSLGGVRRASAPLALTSDGGLLLTVNPDSNSISLIETVNFSKLAEVPVGVDPRHIILDESKGRAYVSNRGSGSVSVVDLDDQQEISKIPVGARPYGLALSPDGSRLYVAEQGTDRLNVIDTASQVSLLTLLTQDRPSALVLSPDGRDLYATHLLRDQISVFVVDPHRTYLPVVQYNNFTAQSPLSFSETLPELSPPIYFTSTIHLFPSSNLVQSMVLAPDGLRAYLPHTRSNSDNQNLTFDTTVFPIVAVVDLEAGALLAGEHFDLGTLDAPGVGLPFDAALTPDGDELWVVNAASNDLTVIDLTSRQLAAHIEVGANPRGIVLSPDGATAYVNNTLAGSVSMIDTAAYAVTGVVTSTQIPLPPVLLRGKRLFHSSDDPRMALNQWISCNTCHFEGEHDGRTWTFGFAGPRNTTGLLGMIETYPLRWSGEWDESADAEFANRKENFGSGLIEGEINCSPDPPDCVSHDPNQGRSEDLDALAAFIDSLQMPLSPNHARGEPLNAAEVRGRDIFNDPQLGCVECHPAPLFTDKQTHDVGTTTEDERIDSGYDTPTLLGLYDSAPYFHDGSAATLYEALTRPSFGGEHDLSAALSETEIKDLIAYLSALPYGEQP